MESHYDHLHGHYVSAFVSGYCFLSYGVIPINGASLRIRWTEVRQSSWDKVSDMFEVGF